MVARLTLFVCTGNICRSPMAEGIARRLAPAAETTFISAGTHALDGNPATGHAVEAAFEIGVDLGGHSARQLTQGLVDAADRIYGLTSEHVRWIASRYPDAPVELLDPDGSDVDDPYGMELEDYRATRQAIVEAITARIEEWA